jgi:hypothetical protein
MVDRASSTKEDRVTGWAWWYPVLAVVAVAVGVYFAVQGAARRGADRVTCWSHALMAAGMAAMFSPWPNLVPALAGALVFTVLGAWFAAVRLRQGPDGTGEATHIAVGAAAMVVMYLGMSSPPSTAEAATGHAGHLAAQPGSSSLLTVAVGLALTGYFAWHAWETTSGTRRADPVGGPGGTATASRVRTETAAHVVLDVLMAVMFLSML